MNVYVIAGPNGSGKTTFATAFLPEFVHCPEFVNADLLAAGLSPFRPGSAALSAGRLVLARIGELARRKADFGFETTLSGRGYLKLIRALRAQGYRVHLYFLWISSPDLAVRRIRERVRGGGHPVPEDDVRRRFRRSIANFLGPYRPLLDTWMLFDNDGVRPRLIAKGRNSHDLVIDAALYATVRRAGGNG